MPIDAATIAQMEQELEEARDQLLREDGRRYQIVMREIAEAEKERILDKPHRPHRLEALSRACPAILSEGTPT